MWAVQTDFSEIDQDESPSGPLRQDSGGQASQRAHVEHSDAQANGTKKSAHPSGQARGQASQANGSNNVNPRTDANLKVSKEKELPSVAAQAERSDVSARERTTTRMGGRKTDKGKTLKPKSNIIVRLPVEDDREAVRVLARKLHNMTIFSDIELSGPVTF